MPSPAITATRYVLAIDCLRSAAADQLIPRVWRPRRCRAGRLFVHVPDVRGELPLPAHLSPHDGIFAGDLLRRLRFCLEAERADFARRPGPERLDIDGRQLGLAELRHLA